MPTSIVKTPRDERLWEKAKGIAEDADQGENWHESLRGKSGIYLIQNISNGKVYVGRSTDVLTRWRHHKASLRKGTHVNPHLQRAWSLYGESAFQCRILIEERDKLLLPKLEAQYAKEFKAHDDIYGYNLNIVSDVSYCASAETRIKQSNAQKIRNQLHPRVCTPEQRERMSIAQRTKKVVVSDETRLKMSKAGKGRKKSQEHRAAIGASRLGWVPSAETREKIRLAHKGKKASEETRKKMSASRTGVKRGPYKKGNKGTITEVQKNEPG